MSNYTLNNVRRSITHIDERDYWDMHLNVDRPGSDVLYDSCLSVFIDTSNPECLSGNDLISLAEYFYDGACSNGLKLENIGYTGVDNGLISYRKDRITNKEFYEIYTKSTYEIESGDTRLHLHAVTGNTMLYDYPTSQNEDGSIKLNGGFYQGFFKSDGEYQILPSEISGEWNLEFDLRKVNYEPESHNTLNDMHPSNKGIFFYIGTRAENKWVYLYEGLEISGTSMYDCELIDEDDYTFDLIDDDIELSAQTYETSNGFDISSANDDYIISDNKFLIFDRTPSGVTIHNYEGDEIVVLETKKRKFKGNLFLFMNRTPTGYTVNDVEKLESGFTNSYDEQTLYNDIYNNALAFLINDDGSIGYRYLVKSCSGDPHWHFDVLSGNSYPGIIKDDLWTKIRVRIKSSGKTMRIMFYVNGKLKYITSELPKLNLHDLDEIKEKQEGVAYNISVGGGTQGLAETIMPDYMYNPTRAFPIEENFSGTFIGDIKSFKLYTC